MVVTSEALGHFFFGAALALGTWRPEALIH